MVNPNSDEALEWVIHFIESNHYSNDQLEKLSAIAGSKKQDNLLQELEDFRGGE